MNTNTNASKWIALGVAATATAAIIALALRRRKMRVSPMTRTLKSADDVRTLIIGDIHGCADEFKQLVQKSGIVVGKDRVVLVGDMVAKGPDSREVIRYASQIGAYAVLGNHDVKVLKWRQCKQRGERTPDLVPAHQEVVKQLQEEDWRWLESLPYILDIQDSSTVGHYYVVHAGLDMRKPIDEQNPQDLANMRSILPDGSVTSDGNTGEAWAKLWPGPQRVFFGHDAVRGLQLYPKAVGLDTGCCYGDRLTGYLLPDQVVISVPALKVYEQPNAKFMANRAAGNIPAENSQ